MVGADVGVVEVVERAEPLDGGVELRRVDADELRGGILRNVDADALRGDRRKRGGGSGGDALG